VNQALRVFVRELAVALAAVVLSLVFGSVLILWQNQNPLEVYTVLFEEALGRPSGLSQVCFKATTLIFTGLAAAFAFRAGLFNIGAEGQLYLGAFTAALVSLALPESTPGIMAILIISLAAALGGALAALIPAALKATRGAHEVINTMMMNFILISVVNWLLSSVRENPEVVRTRAVSESWRLPLFVRGFDGNISLFLGIAVAVGALYLLSRTRTGYELRAVGLNPAAAEYGGVAVGKMMMLALIGSGAIAGLGGINFVLGSPGYFEQHFAPFQGFLGIAVALLARNHPLGVVPAAFLFAVLAEGSQSIQSFVPKELGNILQSIVVVFVVVCARAANYLELRAQRAKIVRA
jgi:simple sugar transport system permease protein